MADYTIKNLRDDVEDSAVAFGYSPALEARFARDVLGLQQSGLSYQRLAPNERSPFAHRHAGEEEIYVVVDGSGRARLGDEVRDIRTWDAIRVGPRTTREFEAGDG